MRVRTPLLSVPIFIVLVVCVNFVLKRPTLFEEYTTPRRFRPITLEPPRRVTKSLAELGPMDDINPYVLFFNRIPKSGSEMLVILMQWLQGSNNFRHLRLKDDSKTKLSEEEQEALVDVMQQRIKDEAVPLSFDKPVHFINFSTFDKQSPTYINLIRDPVDNFVARYHFMPTTANPQDRFYSVIIKNKIPIEKCIHMRRPDCNPKDNESYDLPISYFCGYEARCKQFNNQWALERAKENVDKHYPVVGILEDLNSTLAAFEEKLPYFFKGVQRMFEEDLLGRYHININSKQLTITKFVRKHLKNLLKSEYEFYNWIKSRLFKQVQMYKY